MHLIIHFLLLHVFLSDDTNLLKLIFIFSFSPLSLSKLFRYNSYLIKFCRYSKHFLYIIQSFMRNLIFPHLARTFPAFFSIYRYTLIPLTWGILWNRYQIIFVFSLPRSLKPISFLFILEFFNITLGYFLIYPRQMLKKFLHKYGMRVNSTII